MSVFTLNIDIDNKSVVPGRIGGGSTIPELSRGDAANIRFAFLRQISGFYDYVDFSGSSLKVGIGPNNLPPDDGQFKLTWNGVTSNAISYNATTAEVQTALAPAVSATVTGLCGVTYGYLITVTTTGIFAGTTAGLGGDSFTLFPASSVLIETEREASANVQMRQAVRLVQQPAAFQDSWTNTQTTGGATLSLVQQGSASQSEIYALTVDNDVYAGQYVLTLGSQSVGISYDANAIQIQEELSKLSGIGDYLDQNGVTRPNVRVDGGSGKFGITFVGNLTNTNVASGFTINDSALAKPPFKSGTITINTSGINRLLRCYPDEPLYLEVALVENGKENTILREEITIEPTPIINTGSAIPASQAQYYTKAEADSLFVEDSTSNVDATNRRLKNSGGTTIVDYGQALFGASGMVDLSGSGVTIGGYPVRINSTVTATGAVSFGGGMAVTGNLGFFGTAPTSQGTGINIANSLTKSGIISFTQPTQSNVVSNVISLGLIPSSTTYGVLPGSIKTLTTTASIYFGQVDSNSTNSVSVVVTGCNLNDIVLLGLPSTTDNGLAFLGHVTEANGLEVDCINATNGNITPATATYRITVIGY